MSSYTKTSLPCTAVASLLPARLSELLAVLGLPQRREGQHLLLGNSSGAAGRSLKITTNGHKAGNWYDFATGEHGDLLDLIASVRQCSLQQARIWALDFLGLHPGATVQPCLPLQQARSDAADNQRRQHYARQLYQQGKPINGTQAQRYLQTRGLRPPYPDSFRFLDRVRHAPSDRHFPCLLLPIHDCYNELCGVQRLYLASDGSGKAPVDDPKRTLGCLTGGAVRLGQPAHGQPLLLGEGMETMLSCQQLTGLPAWAALGSAALQAVILSDAVSTVWICCDNDTAGIAAAETLAARLLGTNRTVWLRLPPLQDNDFNDTLQRTATCSPVAQKDH